MSSKDASKEAGSPSKVKTDADSNNAPKSTLELLEEDDEFEEFDQGNWDSNSAQQEEDKQLCGSIGGQISQDWWSDEKYVSDAWFYVYKNNRKSTIAKKLLQHFINVIKEAKMNLRLGHVFSGDIDRKDKFYERMGFVKAGSIYVEK